MKTIRIGAGAGYAGDRIQPALDLIERGELDYVAFECLAERTIALAQQRKSRNPNQGYDPMLEARMRQVLPACHQRGARLISNMGAANPVAATARTREMAESLGIRDLKIAAITGDDVLPLLRNRYLEEIKVAETGMPLSSLGERLISANAYLGAEPIIEALQNGAHVVLGGRIADPALFLAPLMHEFSWRADDYEMLGRGILVGHLLECAGQLSGGYFSDPPYKEVPDLAHLGFPYAEVSADGCAEFSKLEGTGGQISVATCKEQLLYEVHDPKRYLTPDVTADFSEVEFRQVAADRVAACGGSGTAHPATLKVSLGCSDGYIGEAQISYAGAGAEERARLAVEIVREQLRLQHGEIDELRCDLIGINSTGPVRNRAGEAPEVRVRVAARTRRVEDAELLVDIVEALYTNGPAAGGGVSKSVRTIVAILSALIPREEVSPEIRYEVTG
jgi:Acyclic terpene utilisation family protein AtuA